jgi:hypothetical protein
MTGLTGWSIMRSVRLTFQRPVVSEALEVTYTKIEPEKPGEKPKDIVDTIIGTIPDRLKKAKELNPEERARRIRQSMKALSFVRESSFDEIADLFGSAEDRAYEPVVPPPPGPFDVESEIPYSMKKTRDGGFSIVLLDKDGRTLTIEHSKDEITEDLKTAYEVFQMMEKTPGFKRLYMRFHARFLPQLKGDE